MNAERVKAALAADHHSRSAYAGRISQKEVVTVTTEDGTPIQKEVEIFLTWDTISNMLELVRERAGL